MRATLRKARDFIDHSTFNVPSKERWEAVLAEIDATLSAEDRELDADELAMIDRAWEHHKASGPVAKVIDDNQPGKTAIIEILVDPPTLGVGTLLFAAVGPFKSETPDTHGWLIECGRQTWWDGRKPGLDAEFTSDPNEAIRFARFEDAELARCWLLEPIQHLLRATEHAWPAKATEPF